MFWSQFNILFPLALSLSLFLCERFVGWMILAYGVLFSCFKNCYPNVAPVAAVDPAAVPKEAAAEDS